MWMWRWSPEPVSQIRSFACSSTPPSTSSRACASSPPTRSSLPIPLRTSSAGLLCGMHAAGSKWSASRRTTVPSLPIASPTVKVERSHREDQKRFYSCHVFYSLDDFAKQLAVHNRHFNSLPMRPLPWLSPVEFSVQYVCQTYTFSVWEMEEHNHYSVPLASSIRKSPLSSRSMRSMIALTI